VERIGVFLCTGCGIGDALNVDALGAVARELHAASVATHPSLCAPEGIETVRSALRRGDVDGVLIAACSHRAKVAEFQFDPTEAVLERVSLREQVVWSHPPNEEDTQLLAEDLLRMGVARLAKMTAPKPLLETIERSVLVVGGGLAGLEAARAIAAAGHPAVLVEVEDRLGGYLAGVKELVPECPPYDAPHANQLAGRVAELTARPDIRILTSSRVRAVTGQPGQFRVEVETPRGVETLTAGAIIQATGARPYDARKLAHLGYGRSPNVITSHELEAMLAAGTLRRPSDSRPPQRMVFIQCAGSRDPQHLPYCSAECCAITLKQMATIIGTLPGSRPLSSTGICVRQVNSNGSTRRSRSSPGACSPRGRLRALTATGTGR